MLLCEAYFISLKQQQQRQSWLQLKYNNMHNLKDVMRVQEELYVKPVLCKIKFSTISVMILGTGTIITKEGLKGQSSTIKNFFGGRIIINSGCGQSTP